MYCARARYKTCHIYDTLKYVEPVYGNDLGFYKCTMVSTVWIRRKETRNKTFDISPFTILDKVESQCQEIFLGVIIYFL